VTIEGFANHAGTTAMNKPAGRAFGAAKFIEAVNRVATSVPPAVGTVVAFRRYPARRTVIPESNFESGARDLNAEKIGYLYQKIRTEADQIATANKLSSTSKRSTSTLAPTDPRIRALIDHLRRELALSTTDAERRRSRRAGHGAPGASRHDLHASSAASATRQRILETQDMPTGAMFCCRRC